MLANLPGTFFTAPISLSDKTSSFEVTVPVELPDTRLTVVTGRTITVTVGIDTQTITRQFDHIPVEFIGSKTELNYHSATTEVTVLVTGPQPLLNQLSENDLSVLVDVSGLNAGDSAQLAPVASISAGRYGRDDLGAARADRRGGERDGDRRANAGAAGRLNLRSGRALCYNEASFSY